jgi:hypothetical protein
MVKEWIKFILVMIVFMAGMVYFTLSGVHHWLFWVVYISIWWYAEVLIAKKIHLHWLIWVILIIALTLFDLWIIETFTN